MPLPDSPLAVIDAWVDAFNATDPARIVSLYARDAVLWGTLSTGLITTRAALRLYFEDALGGTPRPSVTLEGTVVQDFGRVAVLSGAYRLRLGRAGGPLELPARFTLVLRATRAAWSIVSHHSSVTPSPPVGRDALHQARDDG